MRWTPKSDWARLRRLSARDRGLLLEAVLCLMAARVGVLILPFTVLRRGLGSPVRRTTAHPRDETIEARRVAWSLLATALRVPWRALCLERALAGSLMLRRRGYASALHLGVARGADGALHAHAWLRCGAVPVTGGSGEQFTRVSSFGDTDGSGDTR